MLMFDPKCLDLADYFLGSRRDEKKDELAQYIQDAIEDWLRVHQDLAAHYQSGGLGP